MSFLFDKLGTLILEIQESGNQTIGGLSVAQERDPPVPGFRSWLDSETEGIQGWFEGDSPSLLDATRRGRRGYSAHRAVWGPVRTLGTE